MIEIRTLDKRTEDECEVSGCDERATHEVVENSKTVTWICEGCARSGAAGALPECPGCDGAGQIEDTYDEWGDFKSGRMVRCSTCGGLVRGSSRDHER